MNLYDEDEHLVASVSEFVMGSVAAGDVVVIIATRAHREAIEVCLRGRGVDFERSREAGQYLTFDAAEMLSTFTDGGELDGDRFRTIVGGLVDRLSADGRRVRAFGEMVALLWENGDVAAAIELESLWNELARTHRFSLYCAYPMASLVSHGDVMATSKVCEHHSDVLAPRSYESRSTSPTGSDDPEERSQLFVPVMSAVAAARRFVRETLVAWHEADLVDDATLVASELATNAVRHAGSAFRLTIVRTDSRLRIAVQDISPQEPSRRDPRSSVPGGRGLAVIELLCVRWGSEPRVDGKVVWAELAR